MNACICGKSYKFRSALSRHQRGNEKQGVKPCEDFQAFEKQRKEEARIKFLNHHQLDKEGLNMKIENHDPENIPDFAKSKLEPFLKVRRTEMNELPNSSFIEGRLSSIIPHYFQKIYMNEEHPEYWNVVIQNVSTGEVRVYENDTWVTYSFSDWVTNYCRRFIVGYVKETEAFNDKGEMYSFIGALFYRMDEVKKHIDNGIKHHMTNLFMREQIKERHGFK
jgi:hypothetical protein